MRFAFSSRRQTTMIDKSRARPRNIFIPVALVYFHTSRECDPTEKTLAPLMSRKRSPFDRSIPWHPRTHLFSLSLPPLVRLSYRMHVECIAIPSVFSISFLLTLEVDFYLTKFLCERRLGTSRDSLYNLGYFMHILLPSMRPAYLYEEAWGNYISSTNCHTRR